MSHWSGTIYMFCDNTTRLRNFMAQGAEQAMSTLANLMGFGLSSEDLISYDHVNM